MNSIVRFGLALCMGLCVLGSVFGAGVTFHVKSDKFSRKVGFSKL
jgi:hypothetical protein